MPVPTAEEAAIYKSPGLFFETKVLVRLDRPVFTSPMRDDFNGSALNPDNWHSVSPSWGLLEVAGGTVRLGTIIPGINESWFVNKENIWLPRSTTYDWTLEFRMRVNVFNGFGTLITLQSLEQWQGIFEVEVNTALGLSIQMPNENEIENLGADTSWNTYRLVYTASNREYEFFIDEEGGGGFVSRGGLSAVDYRADLLVFGNAGSRQGILGDFSEIEIDYVEVIGTSEAFEVPEWAAPQYLYDQLQYQAELWAELPSVIGGTAEFDKENAADTLQLDLINFVYLDQGDPAIRAYTHFNFMNRFIKVLNRVSNGERWTPWRQIYLGSCDEKSIEQRSDGSVVLTLRARDWVRKRLAETRTIRAYSDYGLVVEGLVMNLSVGEIIQDIAQNVAGLPYSAISLPATPFNTPRTFNIPGSIATGPITDLMRGMGWTWYVDHTTGQVIIGPFFFGTGIPQYWMRTDEEIMIINWDQSSLNQVAQAEINITNTEFQDGGFGNTYPETPVPFYGRIEIMDIITAQQNNPDLLITGLPFEIFRSQIRRLGGLKLTAPCQDWVTHDIELGIIDNSFLGIKAEDGPWIVDGYRYTWKGTVSFETEITLANAHPDRVLLDSATGHL